MINVQMMVVQSRNHEEDEQGGGELVFMSQIKQDSSHQEKKPKPLPDGKSLQCPRCESVNTKFCYYNNYSLSQPRYFCKGCRRYWTQGGSLRNVPVGGGCRKNKRCSPSSSTTTASTTTTTCTTLVAAAAAAAAANACHNNNAGQFLHQHQLTYEYDPSDLSLAFGRLHAPINPPPLVSLSTTPHYESGPFVIDSNCNSGQIIHHSPEVPGFLDILRGGFFDANPIAASGHTNFFYGLGGNLEGEEENLPFFPIGGEISNESPQMMKHESPCKSDDGGSFGDRRVDGVQQNWQVGGVDGTTNMMMAGLDSGRDYYWSSGGVGGGGGVWHGLVNSSLM